MKRSFQPVILLSVYWAVLSFFACSSGTQIKNQAPLETPVSAVIDSSFELAFNQTAVFEPDGLSIKFSNVAEDSRCPEGYNCVWQGQAKIALKISKRNNDLGEIKLTSLAGHDSLAREDFDGYSIKLLKVGPARKNKELLLSDYLITLIVSKK